MMVNKWQQKKQAAHKRSRNQHAAKARKRLAGPPGEYPADRLEGRRYNILINEPWARGNNTRLVTIDFAPRPHRRDRIVYAGRVMSMSEFLREEMPKILPAIQDHCL
jgi:hypothetical protein